MQSTEENRCTWRSLLVNTPSLGDYISGIILFEETLGQTTDNTTTIPAAAWKQGIVPGIKVDKGTVPLALSPGDLVTQGLDRLPDRLRRYKEQGARYAAICPSEGLTQTRTPESPGNAWRVSVRDGSRLIPLHKRLPCRPV